MPRKFKPEAPDETTVASGQPYGERQETEAAMDQVPLSSQGPSVEEQAQQMPFEPIGMGPPTDEERAAFPPTAGAPFGPGPNAASVDTLPPQVDDDDMQALTKMLPLLERLASKPGSSAATRRVVRQVKAAATPYRPGMGAR